MLCTYLSGGAGNDYRFNPLSCGQMLCTYRVVDADEAEGFNPLSCGQMLCTCGGCNDYSGHGGFQSAVMRPDALHSASKSH